GAPLVAHQAKWLMRALAIDVRTLDVDTAVMAYLLDPADGKYELNELSLRHLGVEVTSPDVAEGTLDFDGRAGAEETGRRAAAVLALADPLSEGLADRELSELYETVERPLVRALALMERAGVLIDVPFLEELRADLAAKCDRYMREVFEYAGTEFNVNSTPQLREILFDKLGLTPVKKTKTGPSTDHDSLVKLQDDHPIVGSLLKYREVEKLRNTYADALPPLVESDGRIHATFKQTATTTGRISSDTPNLQNIPVRTAEGMEMRRAFCAPPGWGLLTADYSQIELRILAHLAEDPGLIDAFARNVDVHTVTAARVFGVDEADVDANQRRFAKVVNYGLAYGMEAYGLAQRADIEVSEAARILDNYFAGFPKVAEYMERVVDEAKQRGYTTTIMGRRRQIAELSSGNFRIRQQGERMAQNAPVQGSAADIFKLAMVHVDALLEAEGVQTRAILTVHDELVFEVPEGEREAIEPKIVDAMEHVVDLLVPLQVDVGFGATWADAK
ncbi:MAG: DNA polymerase, partial [Acidimicrobiia bacterium]